MQTFGLSKSVPTDIEALREAIDANWRKIGGVVEGMYSRLQDGINGNAVRLGRVEGRMHNVVRGHIRRQNQIVKQIDEKLLSQLRTGIAETAGAIAHLSSNPAVREAMLEYSPPITRTSPMPPIPSGTAPRKKPPPMLSVDALTQRTYTILATDDCTDIRAVPGNPGDWYLAGWEVPDGWNVQQTVYGTPSQVQQMVDQLACQPKTA